MHFQIWTPSGTLLRDVGLGDLAGANARANEPGPAGAVGIVWFWPVPGDPHPRTGYRPAEQTWIPALAHEDLEAGRYHLGVWNDSPPKPVDLIRPDPLDGQWVELGDGQQWLVPVAARVPKRMAFGAEGDIEKTVQERYRWFWDESAEWAGRFFRCLEAEASDIAPDARSLAYIHRVLSLNYRLPRELVNHLGLFDEAKLLYAIGATVDQHEILMQLVAEKKTPEPTGSGG